MRGQPVAHELGGWLSPLPRRLEFYLAQWPLWPPSFWSRRGLWVGWGLLVWTTETFTPAVVHTVPLGLVSVLLAAWAGSLAWSLRLACVLPWGAWISWWWWGGPWPWSGIHASPGRRANSPRVWPAKGLATPRRVRATGGRVPQR